MYRRMLVSALIVMVPLVAVGCGPSWGTATGATPVPPTSVNAALPNNSPYYGPPGDPAPAADAVVVARIDGTAEYHRRTRGNWVHTWSVTTCEMIQVERGHWPDKQIRFIVVDSWPTPESGIQLRKKLQFPYLPGTVHAFSLDTSATPARIVHQQQRSILPPHGPAVSPWAPTDRLAWDRLVKAMADYAANHPEYRRASWQCLEQTPQAYVVLAWWGAAMRPDAYRLLQVDRRTHEVRPLH